MVWLNEGNALQTGNAQAESQAIRHVGMNVMGERVTPSFWVRVCDRVSQIKKAVKVGIRDSKGPKCLQSPSHMMPDYLGPSAGDCRKHARLLPRGAQGTTAVVEAHGVAR